MALQAMGIRKTPNDRTFSVKSLFVARLYLLVLFLWHPVNNLSAQNSKVDSLMKLVLSQKKDTISVNHLFQLGVLYNEEGKRDSALKFVKLSNELAQKIKDKKWEAKTYNLFFEQVRCLI